MSIETSDTFGNYLIQGIDEIVLPRAVSWWPSAPGWKVLAVVVGFLLVFLCYRWFRYWWSNRYRREALRQLTQVQHQAGERWQDVVARLPYFLKVTALHAYPRADVANLSGKHWLHFLDAHYPGTAFGQGVGKTLLQVSYLPRDQWKLDRAKSGELIRLCKHWIAKHTQTDAELSRV